MARWEGNTRRRLELAAMDLFHRQGYDGTTVAQIAELANLTERSFYRWFADKRAVLFADDELELHLVTAIEAVPAGTGAFATLLAAFATAPKVFRPREFLRQRATVIAANPPLQERELIKLATLSGALTGALERRGHPHPAAQLATDAALSVLRLTAERCLADETAEFADVLASCAADLKAVLTDS